MAVIIRKIKVGSDDPTEWTINQRAGSIKNTNVRKAVEKCEKVLKKLKIDYEILLIDDGSKDNTAKIVDQIAKENSHVQAIHHQKNLGYGEALKSGFYNAKYEVIVYTDGDGQFDFSEVEKFLKEIETNDLVIGYRIK